MSGVEAGAGLDATVFRDALTLGLETSGIGGNGEIKTYDDLVAEFGQENVDNAIANLSDRELAEAWKAQIAESEFVNEAGREAAFAEIDAAVDAGERPTTQSAQEAVNELLLNNIRFMTEELAEEGAASADGKKAEKKGAAGGGGAGNWLVLMAQAMAKIAGDHLANALSYAEQIGTMTAESLKEGNGGIEGFEYDADQSDEQNQARATTLLQAKMQAETQLFKMVFEAGSTLIKTAGEGFSTMARKQ